MLCSVVGYGKDDYVYTSEGSKSAHNKNQSINRGVSKISQRISRERGYSSLSVRFLART